VEASRGLCRRRHGELLGIAQRAAQPIYTRPGPPSLSSLWRASRLTQLLEDLVARLQRGERLYIHCWGGRGRAGTVGSCLLAKLYGIGANEALARIDRAFCTRKDEGYRSPETAEQQQ
jgi:hypothetical protein